MKAQSLKNSLEPWTYQTIEKSWWSFSVNPKLSLFGEVVGLADVVRVLALGDPDHPEELVDVVAGVSHDAAKDDQDVVDVQVGHDLVGGGLVRRHGFADLTN